MDNPLLIIALFIPIFILFWMGISFLLSLLSGWRTLAEYYPSQTTRTPQCWSFQQAYLRGFIRYQGALIFCADQDGLYIRPIWLFRVGHPPLFIPWYDVSGTPKRHFLLNMVDLRFRRADTISFYIHAYLADRLAASSQGQWQYLRED